MSQEDIQGVAESTGAVSPQGTVVARIVDGTTQVFYTFQGTSHQRQSGVDEAYSTKYGDKPKGSN